MNSKFEKITEDKLCKFSESEFDSIDNHIAEIVGRNLFGNTMDYRMVLEESLIDCESPIEQLLSMELERIGLRNIFEYNPFIDVLDIEKQKRINLGSKNYRVDFFIPVVYYFKDKKIYRNLIIECDGYEFHQKTKQQVEKDNIRSRDLQKQGYEIIRFSGTEIYHKTYKCACEIRNIIISKMEKYFRGEDNG